MERIFKKFFGKTAVTLLECVLAMGLSVLIMVPLVAAFRANQHNWWLNLGRGIMIQESRMTMHRVTYDLRYAEKLLQLTNDIVEFETRYLEDTDDGIETIKYERTSFQLYRSVDGGPAVNVNNWQDYYFTFTGYKVDGSDHLVPLDIVGGDTIDDAVAIGIDYRTRYYDGYIGLKNVALDTFSLVALRGL